MELYLLISFLDHEICRIRYPEGGESILKEMDFSSNNWYIDIAAMIGTVIIGAEWQTLEIYILCILTESILRPLFFGISISTFFQKIEIIIYYCEEKVEVKFGQEGRKKLELSRSRKFFDHENSRP